MKQPRATKSGGQRKSKERRVKRERFLPHAFVRHGFACRVSRVTVDGGRDVDVVDEERHLVALDGEAWDAVEIGFEVEVDAGRVVAEVFPEPDRQAPPGRIVIVGHGAPTRLRAALAQAGPPLSSRHELTVRLRRADVRGTVELTPLLVRTRGADRAPGYATEAGARLASARTWSVRVDRVRDPEGQFLDTRYRPFSEDERLRPHADTLYHLELGDTPTLWINSEHETIVPVLDDKGTRGPRARTREVLFDLISQSVWTQLFVQAASDLSDVGETVYSWEDSVLRELLSGLFAAERTHPARRARLREALSRGELPVLLGRLDAVLQRRNQLVEHITKLLAETVERRT